MVTHYPRTHKQEHDDMLLPTLLLRQDITCGIMLKQSAVSMDLETPANSHEGKSMLITSTADNVDMQATTDTLHCLSMGDVERGFMD